MREAAFRIYVESEEIIEGGIGGGGWRGGVDGVGRG